MWLKWMTPLLSLSLLSGCASLNGPVAQLGRQLVQEIAPGLLPEAKADVQVQSASGDWCKVMKALKWPDPTIKPADLGPSAQRPVLRIYVYGEGNCPGWNPSPG